MPFARAHVRSAPAIVAAVFMAVWPAVLAAGQSERIHVDSAADKPLVVHVVVALCDNVYQGIVPVPRALGNGQDTESNLYWGAQFGVRGYFRPSRGWTRVPVSRSRQRDVLERVAFRSAVAPTRLYVMADAWDGAHIREALTAFLEMASGRARESVAIDGQTLQAGGASHVVAFVGHNGFMDFPAPSLPPGTANPARAAVVLACASQPYFAPLLQRSGAYPLLLTTGLMAPEAYSLDAALRAWFTTTDPVASRRAAADAYRKHQGCGLRAARRLFGVQ